MQKERFKGKVAVVTGANAGIGLATAEAFAREGARVVIADIVNEADNAAVPRIKAQGGEAIYVKTDVSRADAIDNLFQVIADKYGRLDCAFNNAAFNNPAKQVEGGNVRLHKMSEEWFDKTIGVNLKGTWLCMRRELEVMLRQGGGNIVNCASIDAYHGEISASAYVASKHGVLGLTKCAALEYAERNIRVNAVCPGFIQTALLQQTFDLEPSIREARLARIPMRRIGKPEDIAGAVLWLCSEEASYVTGQDIIVDGGFLI